jgi:hypothetical protein
MFFLNNALNQILEDTLLSVLHSAGKPYLDDPLSAGIDESLSKNVVAAAVDCAILMIGMIPVCVASLARTFFEKEKLRNSEESAKASIHLRFDEIRLMTLVFFRVRQNSHQTDLSTLPYRDILRKWRRRVWRRLLKGCH